MKTDRKAVIDVLSISATGAITSSQILKRALIEVNEFLLI